MRSFDSRKAILEFHHFLVPICKQKDLLQSSQILIIPTIIHKRFFLLISYLVDICLYSCEYSLGFIPVHCLLIKFSTCYH